MSRFIIISLQIVFCLKFNSEHTSKFFFYYDDGFFFLLLLHLLLLMKIEDEKSTWKLSLCSNRCVERKWVNNFQTNVLKIYNEDCFNVIYQEIKKNRYIGRSWQQLITKLRSQQWEEWPRSILCRTQRSPFIVHKNKRRKGEPTGAALAAEQTIQCFPCEMTRKEYLF